MTGVELAREVRRQRPQLPILLATGFAELEGVKVIDVGRLAKPYTQDQLAAEIARLLFEEGCKLRAHAVRGHDRRGLEGTARLCLPLRIMVPAPRGAVVVVAGALSGENPRHQQDAAIITANIPTTKSCRSSIASR
jgi:hypothetical protein